MNDMPGIVIMCHVISKRSQILTLNVNRFCFKFAFSFFFFFSFLSYRLHRRILSHGTTSIMITNIIKPVGCIMESNGTSG